MPRDHRNTSAEPCYNLSSILTPQPGLRLRRWIFAGLVGATMATLIAAFALLLAGDGLGWLDVGLLGLFAVTLPWLVVGFWNGAIGLFILVRDRGRLDRILPIAQPLAEAAIAIRTAIVMPIHDEDPDLVFRNLRTIVDSLRETGVARAFEVFVLSDTRDDAVAAREKALFQAWRADEGDADPLLNYRRRRINAGFKAGNIRRFCDRWGDQFDLMVVLDADSLMLGPAMLHCVRLMQANPDLGILQTLVVGLPTDSPFARLFQFGMRHGMRTYTVGSAWWQGDCGPYWGHNAIVRLAPFIHHCRLPRLAGEPPLGGDILSHDQVEAVLMRKAGWAVRVLPIEEGSWEATPPTLPDYIRRDLRWCHGNLQYLRLRLPGLHLMGRVQIGLAILMYAGSPAWLAFLALGTLGLFVGGGPVVAKPNVLVLAGHAVSGTVLGIGIFATVLALSLAPKIFGLVYALTNGRQRQAFGGGLRLVAGAVAEVLFSMLLAPVMSVAQTVFIAGLMTKRRLQWRPQWRPQMRFPRSVGWATAARYLWPQTTLGLVWAAMLMVLAPATLPWAAPVLAGLVLAIPLAVVTSRPVVGRLLHRLGIGAMPEELAPTPEIAAVCPRWRNAPPAVPIPAGASLFEPERG